MQLCLRQTRTWWKAGFSSLLIAIVLGCGLFAASPALHAAVHDNSTATEHECAIALFALGQVDADASPTTLAAFVLLLLWVVARPGLPPVVRSHYRLLPGRAPPVSH